MINNNDQNNSKRPVQPSVMEFYHFSQLLSSVFRLTQFLSGLAYPNQKAQTEVIDWAACHVYDE